MGGDKRKRPRRHSTGAAQVVSPHPGETQAVAMVATRRASFSAPYLKGGGTHFEKKVEKAVALLMAAASPLPAKNLPARAVAVKTRRTSGQMNAEWRNDKRYREDTGERYKPAMKEATTMFVGLREGKRGGTQQSIVDSVNKKYNLTGEGRGTREKNMIVVRTV